MSPLAHRMGTQADQSVPLHSRVQIIQRVYRPPPADWGTLQAGSVGHFGDTLPVGGILLIHRQGEPLVAYGEAVQGARPR